MKIIVLGAGAWGSAVAMSAAQHPAGHAVTLWARDAAQAQSMRAQAQNARYLPGIALPPSLSVVAGDFSGPSFAQEVALGQPTALVAASAHAAVRDALVNAFHSPSVRVYANEDIVGVEVGGAVKNVLAIATGLCDGLALGLNARAALITRGLAEMTRLG